MEYKDLQRCIRNTKRKYSTVLEVDFNEVINAEIVNTLNPCVWLLYDLVNKVPKVKLTSRETLEYKRLLQVMKRVPARPEKHLLDLTQPAEVSEWFPITKVKVWEWDPKMSKPLTISGFLFWRQPGEKKTQMTLHIQRPLHVVKRGEPYFIEGKLTVSDSKANEILKYLIKEGLEFGL